MSLGKLRRYNGTNALLAIVAMNLRLIIENFMKVGCFTFARYAEIQL